MVDVLADVLAVTQMGNSILAEAELLAPWGLEIDPQTKATVHVVRRGVCWLVVERREPTRLVPGDVVLLARGIRHALVDDPQSTPEPYEEAVAKMERRLAARRPGRHDDSTMLLCAAYEFEQDGPHPLLALLPKFIHLHAEPDETDGQLAALVRLLMSESRGGRAGSAIVVPRLVDTLFVLVIRAWLEGQPAGAAGWFGALRDVQVGRVLSLIHEQPATRWTVEQLADEVALSRAAFARRFAELVGEPPLAYVTRWRMSLASKMLRTTDATIDSIAQRVGYESAPAFAKAFRRHFRTSPGQYRRARE